uniref:SHSP domain-containing protein n=1 Tax=Glossina morsitans morsitans TaxID=37546 RepID=A0A1A9YUI8_GLOMM
MRMEIAELKVLCSVGENVFELTGKQERFYYKKMSVVPLMFRDWWDELDFPMGTSRLLDQHFDTGLMRDDLMSSIWSSRPTLLRSGYLRPWQRTGTGLQKLDSGSTLNVNDEKFEVNLDVQQFPPNEITLKVTDKSAVVEAKHEEKQDEHGYYRGNLRDAVCFQMMSILTTLLHRCHLTVILPSAPMKKLPPPGSERVVPIAQTGPSSKEDNEKKVETTTA